MYPEWKQLLQADWETWTQYRARAASASPFVLVCSSVGGHSAVITHDSLLAAALVIRGVRVEALLCDAVLPACELCTIYGLAPERLVSQGPQATHCSACEAGGTKVYEDLGIPLNRYGAFLRPEDSREAAALVAAASDDSLQRFELDDVRLGEEAYAGALRFFAVGDLAGQPDGIAVLRRYLRAAIITLRVIQRAFDLLRPDIVVFHHGIYVPQGIIGRVARQRGIRVVNWSVGYRKQTFVYSHDDTYHRTMIDEPVHLWQGRSLSESELARLTNYLDSRRNSSQDWIKFNQEPQENSREIRRRLGVDERPVVLLLTNVTWDAQLYYKNNGFPSLLDWLEYTIRSFANRTDLQLVIRVHPGEVRGTMRTRQPVMEAMATRIPKLPANVSVVEAESDISTYTLAEMADSTIIFGTKTGVELTARGLPVIVVGEAWIRNKGLTIDVVSRTEYDEILAQLPLGRRMTAEQTTLALRYAFHYFFRRLVPLRALADAVDEQAGIGGKVRSLARKLMSRNAAAVVGSPYRVSIASLDSLQPGNDPGLDLVCVAILSGTPFIYDEA
jgi:hypothetical protein